MLRRFMTAVVVLGVSACGIFGDPDDVSVSADDAGPNNDSVGVDAGGEVDAGPVTPEFLQLEPANGNCSPGTYRLLAQQARVPQTLTVGPAVHENGVELATTTLAWTSLAGRELTLSVAVLDDALELINTGSHTLTLPNDAQPGSVLLIPDAVDGRFEISVVVIGPQYARGCMFSGLPDSSELTSGCRREAAIEEAVGRENISALRDIDFLGVLDEQTWTFAPRRAVSLGGSRGDGWLFALYQLDSNFDVTEFALPVEFDGTTAGTSRLLPGVERWTRGYPAMAVARRADDGVPTTSLLGIRDDSLGYEVRDSLGVPPPSAQMAPGKFVFLADVDTVTASGAVDPDASTLSAGWVAVDQGSSRLWLGRTGGFGNLDLGALDLGLEADIDEIALVRDWSYRRLESVVITSTSSEGTRLGALTWDLGLNAQVNPTLSAEPWDTVGAVSGASLADHRLVAVSGTREGTTGVFIMELADSGPCP